MDIATHGPTPASADRSWLGSIDRAVGGTVERIAAVLVAAEIVILFAGIVARYLLHRPLTWSDELASILFLWLAMLGAVIAIRAERAHADDSPGRPAHAARRDFFEALAIAAASASCLLIASAGRSTTRTRRASSPPRRWSSPDAWRASAFPVGIVLMIGLLPACGSPRAPAVQARHRRGRPDGALIIAAFWLLGPSFKTLGNLNLIVFFVRRGHGRRLRRRADRLLLRPRHLRLPRADHARAD